MMLYVSLIGFLHLDAVHVAFTSARCRTCRPYLGLMHLDAVHVATPCGLQKVKVSSAGRHAPAIGRLLLLLLLYQRNALYGAEAWGMRSAESRKVNVLEMKCLKTLVGVSRMDRVRNEEVRRRPGIEMELASRADGKNG